MESIRLHPKQGRAFESEKKITLCCSGIQGGKTTVGALWFLRQVAKWAGPQHNFIIGAPTYKILNQATLPTFFKYAEGLGTYHKVDQEFHFFSGPKCYIRTGTDPFSAEGIQDVRAIWLDEAGLCKYSFWVNLEGRASRTGAPIVCTTTPYGMNWPYQHIIKPLKLGEREDVAYFEWTSVENPSFPLEEYERQKSILDPRVFRQRFMGIHERMQGLVYELTEENYCDPKRLPQGTRYFGGVDWGFADGHEFAISIRAVTLDGFHYAIDEFKQAGLEPSKQIAVLKAKMETYNVERFLCDPARPDMISEANKNHIPSIGFHVAHTNYKQIVPGINKHIELIRSGRYKIFRGRCPHMEDEYETYHWPEHEEGKTPKDNPLAVNDHLMDTERYLSVGTMNVKIKEPQNPYLSRSLPEIDDFNPKSKSKRRTSNWNSM